MSSADKNIYTAIMKAADHIEANPDLFAFDAIHIPTCGTPGCALGWIGFMANVGAVDSYDGISLVAGGGAVARFRSKSLMPDIAAVQFYQRMDGLVGKGWIDDHLLCAKGMRIYAETYHGHEKPKPLVLPNWHTIAASPLIPEHVRSEEVAHV